MSAFTTTYEVVKVVKGAMNIRTKAVILYEEGITSTKEICNMYGISDRTLRRWYSNYKLNGMKGLSPRKPGPKKSDKSIPKELEQQIVDLKQKYPSWGARRIKYQFDVPVHWKTVHNVIKRKGLLIRIKAKPQPCKRFARHHVDSMWQCDTFQFRIRGLGKVYVTGFTDDCSRYRIRSKAYLNKDAKSAVNCLNWALRKGRVPKQIYLDNGKQFVSKSFKQEASNYGIKLIFGKPYHPRGRGKIERYHKALHQELICIKEFHSLRHFRKELWKFDKSYNDWRKQEALGWQTPASVYNNEKYFNKDRKLIKKRTITLATN